ncbi:hypothetical protein C2E23DRAFT_839249 [Lenzites betulinus]|nr:hypothetical protein C2E23DRAFT_839249 [Lenzites betulinus]
MSYVTDCRQCIHMSTRCLLRLVLSLCPGCDAVLTSRRENAIPISHRQMSSTYTVMLRDPMIRTARSACLQVLWSLTSHMASGCAATEPHETGYQIPIAPSGELVISCLLVLTCMEPRYPRGTRQYHLYKRATSSDGALGIVRHRSPRRILSALHYT